MLFVGTKKQARDSVKEIAEAAGQPYVNHRWLGGLLTNFQTISQRIRRLHDLERYETEGQLQLLPTRERMAAQADLEKLQANLGGVKHMQRPPDAMFVVDLKTEVIAVREAQRLRIPIIGLVDTNCDPDGIDFVIPGNDDAIRACALITKAIGDVVSEGRQVFRAEEEKARQEAEEQARREAEEKARREQEEKERAEAEARERAEAEAALATAGTADAARRCRGARSGRRRAAPAAEAPAPAAEAAALRPPRRPLRPPRRPPGRGRGARPPPRRPRRAEEAPKAEEPEAEAPAAEEPKAEEPAAEEPEAEEPEGRGARGRGPRPRGGGARRPRSPRPRPAPAAEEPKAEEPKAEAKPKAAPKKKTTTKKKKDEESK